MAASIDRRTRPTFKGYALAMKALWIGIDGIRLRAEKSRPAWNEAPDKRKTY